MPLNADQQAAADAVFQFLLGPGKEFIISGPAGTGKTYLMDYIMRTVLPEYADAMRLLGSDPVDYEIALTATTNKATEVLAQATGYPAQTIHSFMNLKVVDNYKDGTSQITRTPKWKVYGKTLIFIDESSMVDTALYKFIHEGTDNSCKIIYLGDHCQMAPVFEKISPVYRNPQSIVRLETPVRNAGQPHLMQLCADLRETVETLDFFRMPHAPGVIDIVDDAGAQAFIDQTFQDETPDARILCYSNARVQEYNQYIRALRGHPATFTAGERVVNTVGIEIGKSFLRVEQEFLIHSVSDHTFRQEIPGHANDPNAAFEAYSLELVHPRTMEFIKVRVPVDPEHFKVLMRYFSRIKDWPAYFFMKNGFPDLRPRDAATVYKAQGSTYETVFLDLANIGKCTDADQLARMLYVGASRASSRLVLYGALPKRLFPSPAITGAPAHV
jgi:hypothetical protein